MKKTLRTLFISMLLSFMIMDSQAQLVVKNRPEKQKPTQKSPRPSPQHIWIENEWVVNDANHTYIAKEAAWVKPPTPNSVWVPGHWKKEKNGWTWILGHWK